MYVILLFFTFLNFYDDFFFCGKKENIIFNVLLLVTALLNLYNVVTRGGE